MLLANGSTIQAGLNPPKRVGEKGEGRWQRIPWDQALDEIAAKISEIKQKYGPEALATSSGTGRTDDEYRMRFFSLFGSPNNIGQGAICYGPGAIVSTAVLGATLIGTGSGRNAKSVMHLGQNVAQSAPGIPWFGLLERKKSGIGKLIVVDPRRTQTAEEADLWLQLRPGTDAALYMAMINVIITEELYDKEFVGKWTYGFDKLVERVSEYTPEKVAEITWVPADKIREAARIHATSKPAVIFHMMGVEHLHNCIEALHCRYALTAITGNLDIRGGEKPQGPHPQWREGYEIDLTSKYTPEQKKSRLAQTVSG